MCMRDSYFRITKSHFAPGDLGTVDKTYTLTVCSNGTLTGPAGSTNARDFHGIILTCQMTVAFHYILGPS